MKIVVAGIGYVGLVTGVTLAHLGHNVICVDTNKEKINLYDHYTLSERIVLPGRGVACNHLGVFDVKRFLIVNIHIRKYTCPICMKYANKCYIDEVMKNIFEINKLRNEKRPLDNVIR